MSQNQLIIILKSGMKFIAVLFLFALAATSYATVSRSRVILVDTAGQNLMFRTNSPANTTAGTYDLELLFSYMRDEAAKNGVEFPEVFTVEAFTFLNQLEPEHRDPEIAYFQAHPEYKLFSKIIVGDLVNPNKYNAAIRKVMAKTYHKWNLDQLDILTTKMHDTLVAQGDIPKVIFFHCVAGEDRTGEVFGAYKMLFNGWTYRQALDFDNQVETRKIKDMSRNGLNWFCYFMQETNGYKGNDCEYLG